MTTPQRPYLLKALYEWIVDNDEIPYVLVNAAADGVAVPLEHVEDGQIVLNLGPSAVRDLVMETDFVMCSSRFGGRAFELVLPMASILAIYGRDSGKGMVFPEEDGLGTPSGGAANKSGSKTELVAALANKTTAAKPADVDAGDDSPDDTPGDGPKPTLRLV